MKKEFAKLEFFAHSDKGGNWETFEEYLEDNDIYITKEQEEQFRELCYILYEVSANAIVYDDGSYDISSIECGGKVYYPK